MPMPVPIPSPSQARRIGVAVRAMAHHRKLAQTVEMIELLCVMLRGLFAECASVPHTFLERHLPHYKKQLRVEGEQEPEEEEEPLEEDGGEEEVEGDEEDQRGGGQERSRIDSDYPAGISAIVNYIAHVMNTDPKIRKIARSLHRRNALISPSMARAATATTLKRKRTRPAPASKLPAEETADASTSTTAKPLKLAKRQPPRAFTTTTAPDNADDNAEEHDVRAFKARADNTRVIFKTARRKKPAPDMPVMSRD